MWCHLCKMKFTDQEIFKVHIMKKHRPASEFYEEYSDSENSERKESEALDDCDESEIEENEENIIMDQEVDNTGNFSSSESCFDSTPETSRVKTRRRTKNNKFCTRETDTKIKTYSKFPKSKLDRKIICSESNDNNKQLLCIINPVANQETIESSKMKNQSTQQPMFAFNSHVSDQLPLPNIRGGFDFNSRNILIWLIKFKEMSRTLKFPLQPRLFKKIKIVHKEIFDCYNTASSNEVTSAVMKVYEEFDNMIHKHITSINEQL